jgi:hypothetical protein
MQLMHACLFFFASRKCCSTGTRKILMIRHASVRDPGLILAPTIVLSHRHLARITISTQIKLQLATQHN